MCIIDKRNFLTKTEFDEYHGFLHPMQTESIDTWSDLESLAKSLPKFSCLGGFPSVATTLSSKELPSAPASISRLFVILSFLAQLFVRGGPKDNVQTSCLPELLAKPLLEAAAELGVEPIVSYASTVQFNIAPFEGHTLDDELDVVFTATGTEDERWFYKIGAMLERRAPAFVDVVIECHNALVMREKGRAEERLSYLAALLSTLKGKLERIYEQCNSSVFYSSARRLLVGWRDDPDLNDESVYGLAGTGSYYGVCMEQSPLLQLVDIVLGIGHERGPSKIMWRSVPRVDRMTLEYFASRQSLRQLVAAFNSRRLRGQFNACIDKVIAFREAHLKVVSHYIIRSAVMPTDLQVDARSAPYPLWLLSTWKDDTEKAKIVAPLGKAN